ncbi:MAG: hypothetical protein JXR88_04270 [Clostridia bacterium]|nr:hypothetical protein [Clostridia bacterium]
MDGYAEKMLFDDMSSREEVHLKCPKCQLELHFKLSDPMIKCIKCGEIFYIEEFLD